MNLYFKKWQGLKKKDYKKKIKHNQKIDLVERWLKIWNMVIKEVKNKWNKTEENVNIKILKIIEIIRVKIDKRTGR